MEADIYEIIILFLAGSSMSLLKEVAVHKEVELSPKARLLYRRASKYKKSLALQKKRNFVIRKRLNYLENMQSDVIHRVVAPYNTIISQFIKSQLRNSTRKCPGRRHIRKEKILGIILYKQSRSAYKLLSKLFELPTKKHDVHNAGKSTSTCWSV